jgi:hypothetical protein
MLSERVALAHIARNWNASNTDPLDNCFHCCRPTWDADRVGVRRAMCPLCRAEGRPRLWRHRRALVAHMRRSSRRGEGL